MKLKRHPFAPKNVLIRLSETVAQCWQRQDHLKIIELLEPAIRLEPTNYRMLLDLGLAHATNHNFPVAERYFQRAILFSPRKTKTLLDIGSNCQNFGRFDLAENFLTQASQQPDATAEVFAGLAEVFERRRHLEKAAEMLDRALHLDPACPPALLTRAKIQRQNRQLEEAEKDLRLLLAKSAIPTDFRVKVLYELAALLDRQARYDEGMSALLEAKAMLLPQAAAPIKALKAMQKTVKRAQESVTEEHLRRWAQTSLEPKHRIALLGGYPRSGTTLLEQVVDSHPQVISGEETEVLHEKVYMPLDSLFVESVPVASVIDSIDASKLQQRRKDYFRFSEELLGQPIGDRLYIDKNPSLTVLLPLLVRVFPEIKFLIAVRDPRDVCLSCFMQAQPLNPPSSAWLTLEETVTDYCSLMGMWLAMKPRLSTPALEVRYEDMVENLEPAARRVLEFLGLPWDERVMRFDEHARAKVVKSPTYAEVTKPIFKTAVGRWRNYQRHFEPYLEKLAPFARAFGYE